MTCGIYKLVFKETDKIYIGLSKNIEGRYRTHLSNLLKGISPIKLQDAYNTYNTPAVEILLECSEYLLESSEVYFISLYNSYISGFNGTKGGEEMPPPMYGYTNPKAKYTLEDYFCAMVYLAEPGYSIPFISKLLNISSRVVQRIGSGESHIYLKELSPILYNKMIEVGIQGRNNALGNGIKYPTILSPNNIEYNITNLSSFCREYDLSPSHIHSVLIGKEISSKGWKLLVSKRPTFTVICPNNLSYVIPHMGIKTFAKEHDLTASRLSSLLRGQIKIYKGWSLA